MRKTLSSSITNGARCLKGRGRTQGILNHKKEGNKVDDPCPRCTLPRTVFHKLSVIVPKFIGRPNGEYSTENKT